MNPQYPRYAPSPTPSGLPGPPGPPAFRPAGPPGPQVSRPTGPPAPPGHTDRARVPGIIGLCLAVVLLISSAFTSALVVQVGNVIAFGVPALILSAASFRRPGSRYWAGLAFVVLMATPVVSALTEYVATVSQIG